MTVYDLQKGQSATVIKIEADGKACARLAACGFTAGSKITVLGYSLFKSSVLLGCRSVRLAVRKSIADKIFVDN
ncbi:MAG: FeoA domain-containing protein [Clostridia bacterium]|nr:FeoA domain-containing protein [Clostridia bacterium]MCD8308421.1 FeoA domain-containing protein [Clostridia bacterium]